LGCHLENTFQECARNNVSEVVRFSKPFQAHGSSDMPVWGPIFNARDKFNEVAVKQRIKNLCAYLATQQEKES
jgi:hypothetical protein